MAQQQDTAPFIRSRRIKRTIRIQEENKPKSLMFDVVAEYPSDALPEWFAPLQAIVEDETFTSMVINLGNRVIYHLSIVSPVETSAPAEQKKKTKLVPYTDPSDVHVDTDSDGYEIQSVNAVLRLRREEVK